MEGKEVGRFALWTILDRDGGGQKGVIEEGFVCLKEVQPLPAIRMASSNLISKRNHGLFILAEGLLHFFK